MNVYIRSVDYKENWSLISDPWARRHFNYVTKHQSDSRTLTNRERVRQQREIESGRKQTYRYRQHFNRSCISVEPGKSCKCIIREYLSTNYWGYLHRMPPMLPSITRCLLASHLHSLFFRGSIPCVPKTSTNPEMSV